MVLICLESLADLEVPRGELSGDLRNRLEDSWTLDFPRSLLRLAKLGLRYLLVLEADLLVHRVGRYVLSDLGALLHTRDRTEVRMMVLGMACTHRSHSACTRMVVAAVDQV